MIFFCKFVFYKNQDKMELKKLPFSDLENSKKYYLSSFEELGVSVNVLNVVSDKTKIPSGNFYKFGVIEDGKFYWYFNNVAVARGRQKMLEIFKALSSLGVNKDSGAIPFTVKLKTKK